MTVDMVMCDHVREPMNDKPLLKCVKCGSLQDPWRPWCVFSEEEWRSSVAAMSGVEL